jgi:AcrR family transcriptional regulator
MKSGRAYTQRARAESTARTRRLILGATAALAGEKIMSEIVLADVAARAGVSVQTVLRHFGSRDVLLAAAREHLTAEVVEERRSPPGDVESAVTAIAAHYEQRGDFVLGLLAQAHFDPDAAAAVAHGKAVHRRWVAETFAPQIAAHPGPADALVDVLVVATDVYAWALLRRDGQLDAATTAARMLLMVRALVR